MIRTRLLTAGVVLAAVCIVPASVSGQYPRSCGTTHSHPPAYQYAPSGYYPPYACSSGYMTQPTVSAPSFAIPGGSSCANGLCRPVAPQARFAPGTPYGAPTLAPYQGGVVMPEGSGIRSPVPSPRPGTGGRIREGSGSR